MKLLSKGESVSNEEALASVRRRLEEKRRELRSATASSAEKSCLDMMDVDVIEDSEEHQEWARRLKKLSSFSITRESVSDRDKSHISFLESVERYLSSIVQQI